MAAKMADHRGRESSPESFRGCPLANSFPYRGPTVSLLPRKRLRRTRSLRSLAFASQARFNETLKQGVGFIGFALEFGVVLAGEEIGMVFQLDQLGECAIG
jgi:hypothetical protein